MTNTKVTKVLAAQIRSEATKKKKMDSKSLARSVFCVSMTGSRSFGEESTAVARRLNIGHGGIRPSAKRRR